MAGETNFWDTLRPVLQGLGLDPHRVENILHGGWPDVDYTHGIMELKDVKEWPKRSKTPARVEFRPGQVPVLMRRWEAGGLSWVLVRVAGGWYLFDGWSSRRVAEGLDRAEFEALAAWVREPRAPWSLNDRKRLRDWLTGAASRMCPGDRARYHRLCARRTVEEVAAELGWTTGAVLQAERSEGLPTDDLLAYWEN